MTENDCQVVLNTNVLAAHNRKFLHIQYYIIP